MKTACVRQADFYACGVIDGWWALGRGTGRRWSAVKAA